MEISFFQLVQFSVTLILIPLGWMIKHVLDEIRDLRNQKRLEEERFKAYVQQTQCSAHREIIDNRLHVMEIKMHIAQEAAKDNG